MPSDQIKSPHEELMAPSWLTMKLKFDSAPDDISDEEDNDKENIDPHPHKHDSECSSPKGDPVKAFVDDEAEEEDDSDNDLLRFRDDEDNGDFEELNDMIATEYEERPIDNENRNELHQKWLEEKDAAGTDYLLRRLKVGSKLRDASLLDEDEGDEDREFSNEAEEDVRRSNVARIDSKKAKQMIAQMFSDKDEAYLSSDDEETEKRLVKQSVLDKAEDQATLFSLVEDESSREVFDLIKKLNIVPETKKKAKSSSFFDTMLTEEMATVLQSHLSWVEYQTILFQHPVSKDQAWFDPLFLDKMTVTAGVQSQCHRIPQIPLQEKTNQQGR